MISARHYWISGRVQGVYFRASACEQAKSLSLTGWVRNLPDGRVEAIAAGKDQALNDFESWLWKGSDRAQVEGVEVGSASPPSADGFEQR